MRIGGCGILGGGERKRHGWMQGSGLGSAGCSSVGWGGRRCLGKGVGKGFVGRRADDSRFVGGREGSRLVGVAVGEGMAVGIVGMDIPVRKKAAAVSMGVFAAFAAEMVAAGYTAGVVGEDRHVFDLDGIAVVVQ